MTTLREAKQEAYQKAIKALSGYNFHMYGYWCGIWVHLNKLDTVQEPNPFKDFVILARRHQAKVLQSEMRLNVDAKAASMEAT